MPTTLLSAPVDTTTTRDDALVRSIFGPATATVEELVARDIEAFTLRRLARA